MQAKRCCPICMNSDVELLYGINFNGNYIANRLPDHYDIVFCCDCGMVYSDFNSTQNDFDNYYKTASTYSSNFSFGGSELEQDKKHFEQICRNIEPFINNDDIGCAKGGLLKLLKNLDYNNIFGVEPSADCISNLEKFGIKAINANIFSIPENYKNKFNFVIMSHVMEHIVDLKKAVSSIRTLLSEREGGAVYIEVPDADEYYSNVKTPYHLFNYEHINHFSLHTLKILFENFGFEIIKTGKYTVIDWPSCWIIAKHTKKIDSTKSKIIKYIEKSEENINNEKIQALQKSQEKLVLWGYGSTTINRLNTEFAKCNIVGIVDSNEKKQGKKVFQDITIKSPDTISKDATILILSSVYKESIIAQIKSFGYKNKILIL